MRLYKCSRGEHELAVPKWGISNNETDLLIRMSIQSFSSSDPWGSEQDGRAQSWWARGKLTVSLQLNIQAVL